MKTGRIILLLLLAPAAAPQAAETLICPDLGTAVQVGNCPSEAELQYTFTGFCSDNQRIYHDDAALCTDYLEYRRLKNVAAWEAANGAFMAYLSCELPAARIRAASAARISVARQGKISLLSCHYGEGITFTQRSRLDCKVASDGRCATNPTACRASCE